MEDLADAAGVSRRTLFNYFPGKDAAVLGDPLEPEPEPTERFVRGGPVTGEITREPGIASGGLSSRWQRSRSRHTHRGSPWCAAP